MASGHHAGNLSDIPTASGHASGAPCDDMDRNSVLVASMSRPWHKAYSCSE